MAEKGKPVVRRDIENRAGGRQPRLLPGATCVRSSFTPGGRSERLAGLDSPQWIRR